MPDLLVYPASANSVQHFYNPQTFPFPNLSFQSPLHYAEIYMTDIKDLEKTLWAAADKLRSNLDAAEYKHVVLGLIFLKYNSYAFSDMHGLLQEGKGEYEGADPEDVDEYLQHNIFFVPEKARWTYLQDHVKQPEIGKLIDDAMDAIERIIPALRGVLPKIYADPELNKQRGVGGCKRFIVFQTHWPSPFQIT